MNTEINFAGIKMKNPVTVASGTFGYGREYSDFFNLSSLGGIITKGTSLKPRSGNKPPRVCETASGMLNSIGLQNPGVEYFAENDLPFLRKFDTAIIVNACGSTVDEYVELCKILNTLHIDGVDGIVWFRALDENSRILYLQQIGRSIFCCKKEFINSI